ncbi:MAG: protein kinase [Planctomycetota bacterium]
MNSDETEFQTVGGQSTSKKLSMQATAPPAEVPGYRLNQFLGAGAFGQVWVGRDLNTGRQVAVKFYLHRGGVNWSLLSREVKNLVQLSADRYVVQVLEVGWDADPPYYVMELIEGGSLEDLLRRRVRLPVGEAVEMFRKICIGLNRCHAKGVLHCDIKPANILLGNDNEPRLADFGQSRFSDDQSPALGTLFYMAPEQAELNSTPDASWDVYAAGAIMFRMLAGNAPYRDQQVLDDLDSAGSLEKRLQSYRSAIQSRPSPDKALQRLHVDRPLARIVTKCIAADPDDRYANVQQILQDLQRRDAIRMRRPLMLLGIVGPLLVLLATTVFGTRSIRQASERTRVALRDEAKGSNQLAAAFAARTMESEIERYFQLARDEASNPEFMSQLTEILESDDGRRALNEIASLGKPANTHGETDARQRLMDVPQRDQLDVILAKRLGRYSLSDDERQPRLATMFVTDARGTILSIAYNEPVTELENSAGKNFSYRTYFHGGRVDLSKDQIDIGSVDPLTWTHLSAAFQSTATRLWKVAVSTPIYLSEARDKPDALFVITINLGDFQLMQSKQGANQVAVVVEARDGPAQGTILQHPLMDQRRNLGSKQERKRYQIDTQAMQELLRGGDVEYRDPLAESEDGAQFDGPWIATMQPVAVPRDPVGDDPNSDIRHTNAGGDTDLLVMVQYRLAKVFEPVEQMRRALLYEGAAAVGSILAVTLTLWFLVRRVGNLPSRRRNSSSSNHAGDVETLTLK